MSKKNLSVIYSIAQGLTTAANVGYSIFHKTKNAIAALVSAGLAFIIDAIAAYIFQGAAIRDERSEAEAVLPTTTETAHEQTLLLDQSLAKKSRNLALTSNTTQSLYIALDISKNYASRYFLLTVLQNVMSVELPSQVFYAVIIADLLLKQSFSLTNETYEVCEEIITRIEGKEKPPFYQPIFYPLQRCPRAIQAFKVAGSLEHVIVDDIAPWFAFLPPDSVALIQSNPGVAYAIISLSAVIGVPLAILIFLQTYLFEGAHTEQHLKLIQDDLVNSNVDNLPLRLRAILAKTINIMGPVHGLSAAASVFVSLRDLIENPWAKWPTATIASIYTFLATSAGVHESEIKEAKMALAR